VTGPASGESGAAGGGWEVTLNGERREVPAGTTLVALLASLGLDPRAVAVERNGEVLRRASLPAVTLQPGDRLEIVRFVQGGLRFRTAESGTRRSLLEWRPRPRGRCSRAQAGPVGR
jgi:thiamine biosynthesis protein ThiS